MTQADAVEVETAMRALVSARIEESVLVALADRRRAVRVLAAPGGFCSSYVAAVRART